MKKKILGGAIEYDYNAISKRRRWVVMLIKANQPSPNSKKKRKMNDEWKKKEKRKRNWENENHSPKVLRVWKCETNKSQT